MNRDGEIVKKNLKETFGFKVSEIREISNASFNDFKEIMGDLKDQMNDHEERGVALNALVYYAGHGLQKTMSYAATNSKKDYPLEKMLRTIASGRIKTHIAAVFDCCRSEMKTRGTAGGAGDSGDDDDEAGQTNLILTFACPPSSTTPAKSTISVQYFEQLKKKVNPATGMVEFKDALIGWRNTDRQAETIAFSPYSMKLRLVGYKPTGSADAGAVNAAQAEEIAQL